MSQDARDYAAEKGASIMIFPPVMDAPAGWHSVYPQGSIFSGVNESKINAFKELFGRRNWPSNG